MKRIIYFLAFIVIAQFSSFAQNDSLKTLKFNTKYYNAVNKWVAFPNTKQDSSYTLGFIYIDEMAGFTFRYNNSFVIKNQQLIPAKKDSIVTSMAIYRLEPKTKLVVLLSDTQLNQLNVQKTPDWLANYGEVNSVGHLKQIGYQYNHIGQSQSALDPLLKAYEIEPHYQGLEFEIGFAYNVLQQFDNAISILKIAIANDETDHLLYKELGYAYINSKQFDEAEKIYLKGIDVSKDDAIKCEMAVNMSQTYFTLKNQEKFDKWAKITRKYGNKNPQFIKYIEYFEKELAKDKN